MTSSKRRQWLIDIVAGGVIGEFVGAIVAWNIAIYLGVPGGYDAGVGDVFAHSPLVGVLWLAALITGPVFWGGRRPPPTAQERTSRPPSRRDPLTTL
jgi:hypothetical protein